MLRVFCAVLVLLTYGQAFADENPIARIENLKDSLIEVRTVYKKVSRPQNRIVSYERKGAGIIMDPSGLIVTNTHTILNAPHILVILRDGTELQAQVAFVAPDYDFSFLKVAAPRPLKAIRWADSSKARLGQEILGVGSSDYDNQSILAGRIKSLVQSRSTGMNEMLEVDLNMSKGDSGGPILDRQGRLLGLVMAKQKSQERSTFAIASNKILEAYMNHKKRHP